MHGRWSRYVEADFLALSSALIDVTSSELSHAWLRKTRVASPAEKWLHATYSRLAPRLLQLHQLRLAAKHFPCSIVLPTLGHRVQIRTIESAEMRPKL